MALSVTDTQAGTTLYFTTTTSTTSTSNLNYESGTTTTTSSTSTRVTSGCQCQCQPEWQPEASTAMSQLSLRLNARNKLASLAGPEAVLLELLVEVRAECQLEASCSKSSAQNIFVYSHWQTLSRARKSTQWHT